MNPATPWLSQIPICVAVAIIVWGVLRVYNAKEKPDTTEYIQDRRYEKPFSSTRLHKLLQGLFVILFLPVHLVLKLAHLMLGGYTDVFRTPSQIWGTVLGNRERYTVECIRSNELDNPCHNFFEELKTILEPTNKQRRLFRKPPCPLSRSNAVYERG